MHSNASGISGPLTGPRLARYIGRMSKSAQPTNGSFARQAAESLARLRGALADLLASLPEPVSKAPDLRRQLDLDSKLSWKVFKVATASNPLSAGVHVPTAAGMKSFLQAAARKTPAARRTAVAKAAADFERLVKKHAGDRTSFDSMVSALSHDPGNVHLTQKRAAFRANCHLYGIQADTQLNCCFLLPAGDPEMIDIATVRGCIDLRRMRSGANWVITSVRTSDSDGVVRRPIRREPLDASQATTHGLSLMPAFSTSPLPQFQSVEAQGGLVLGELVGSDVGKTSALTCMTGDVVRSVASVYKDEHNEFGEVVAVINTPCKVLIHDVLIRRGLFGPISPELQVLDDYWRKVSMSSVAIMPEAAMLTTPESVQRLGTGASVLPTPDVPRYLEMANYVSDRLGLDLDDFEVFRCRVEFPVMHSAMVIRFELLDPPSR